MAVADDVHTMERGGTWSLVELLRERTGALHREAERTGIVRRILRGQVSREGYALYLRNLLPAYESLERALEGKAGLAARVFVRSEIYRAAAIRGDLEAIAGSYWLQAYPVLPEGRRYAERISSVAAHDPSLLLAHAYTRYLGDLSGGQIMDRFLARTLGLDAHQLAFYRFPDAGDLAAFKSGLLDGIDRWGCALGNPDGVLEEASEAFRLNIAVSQAVHLAVPEA